MRKTPRNALLLTAPWLLGCAFGGASAQGADPETSVAQRELDRQAGAATGLRLGSFRLSPTVLVEPRFDDNIYATDTDRRADFIVALRPEVAIRSDFGRNALNGRAYFVRDFHRRYTTEDVSQYGANVEGRYDLAADTRLTGTLAYDHAAESRGSLGTFRGTSRPAQFTSLEGQVSIAQEFGPLSLAAAGRVRDLRYDDALLNGVAVDQTFRDQTISAATLSASYGWRELTRLVVVATAERRRFKLRPGDPGFDPLTSIDRSSDGFVVEAGVERDVTALLRASLRIGYLRYDYADPALRDIAGFSYFGNVDWNVTRLTTVRASASRRLDETTSPVTAGNLRDEVRLAVDHELFRTLIVSAGGRYAAIDPSDLLPDSTEVEASFGGRYYLGRRIRVEAELRHSRRSSADRTIAFRANSVRVGFRLTL